VSTRPDTLSNGEPPSALWRRVTAFTAGCVIVSNMIGTGIFGTTGFMARDLGSPGLILLLWAVGGVYALLGAVCYAELGAAMPRAGGEYIYIRAAYGPLPGFLSGWMSLTIGFSAAIASNAHLFAIHLRELFPSMVPEDGTWAFPGLLLHPTSLALVMVWALTLVHVTGVVAGGFVQRVLTVVKVGAILAIIIGGVTVGEGRWSNVTETAAATSAGLATVVVSFLFVSFSYSGWNAAGYIAGEMVDPGRSVPKATVWATVCVTGLYVALNVIYLYAMPAVALAADPIEPVAQKCAVSLFGGHAASWITAMLCVSILGAASAMIWAGPRIYFAMAEDGVFPKMFGGTTASGGAPARSIFLQSVWISVLVISGGFESLVIFAGSALIVFTALAVAAVPVLRRRSPDLPRPYRVAAYPIPHVLFLIISAAVMWASFTIRPMESLLGVATVLVGVPFFYLWRRPEEPHE